MNHDDWSVVYKSAYNRDGSSVFPEKLPLEELDRLRKELGSYIFANQYLNKIIPDEARIFRPEWLKAYSKLPDIYNTTAFIDPAIGQDEHHDFTALTIVHADPDGNWFLRVAKRLRINPTQIVDLCFRVAEEYSPTCIGIETVAFQEALLHMVSEEMKRRQKIIPVKGLKRSTDKSKIMRISALVPRFEWGRILINQGLTDFEDEYTHFPRGAHDDLLDSLASHDEIILYPERPVPNYDNVGPNHPMYEKKYIESLRNRRNHEDE